MSRFRSRSPVSGSSSESSFKIFVERLSGDTITLVMKPDDSVNSIRAKIKDIEGIPVDQQRLSFEGRLLELSDGSTLLERNINNESRLNLAVTTHFECFVLKWPEFDWIVLDVDGADTVDSVKAKIHEVAEIPPDRQLLYAAGQFPIDIHPRDQPLEGGRTLMSYSVNSEESELILVTGP
jgi:ubiquitin C